MKPGKRRLLDRDGAEAAAEKRKASVRAKVEHPFLYVKRRFGYGKVRYRGLSGPRDGSRTHRSDFLTVRTVYNHRSDRPSNRIFEPQPIAFLPKWGCSDLP